MTQEQLKNLDIESISKDNSLLFMWATFRKLPECLEIIKSWGFKYQGLGFCWIKKNKKSNTNFWGMGYYTRQNPEICLIARKGKFTPLVRNVHSVVESQIEQHSKKPDVIREFIERICGDVSKIELFARQKVEGWDSWGNETNKLNPVTKISNQQKLIK